MGLLARREHSRQELQRKLLAKGAEPSAVEEVLDELAADRLQDDARFAASYIHCRSQKGYGPRRILVELIQRGIAQEFAAQCLEQSGSVEWLAALERVWQKKFSSTWPQDKKTLAKQANFLIYRGFSPDQVYCFLEKND